MSHPFDAYQPGNTVSWDVFGENLFHHLRRRGLDLYKSGYGEWTVYATKNPPKPARLYNDRRLDLAVLIGDVLTGEFTASLPQTAHDIRVLKDLLFEEEEPKMIRLVNIKALPSASYDLYIGRANEALGLPESKWHNPFHLERESEREEVLALYKAHIESRPDLLEALPELDGLRLGCYCFPKRCHGNVLIELFHHHVLHKYYAPSERTAR